MTRREIKLGRWFTIACLTLMIVFLFTIVGRYIVRHIIVKKFGITNGFTAALFYDVPSWNIAPNDKKISNDVKEIDIDWQNKYPFENGIWKEKSFVKKYQERMLNAKRKFNERTVEKLMGRVEISKLAEAYSHFICGDLVRKNPSGAGVFFLNNGYITYYQQRVKDKELVEIAKSLQNFRDWLAIRNIPLLYINNGSKVNPHDKQMSRSQQLTEFTNENADFLEKELAKLNIDYIDMRQEMLQAGLDWYDSYYKYDHHWKTQTGMWAACIIAEKLNKDYGFIYDMKYFYPNNYESYTYNWKGGQWRYLYTTTGWNCDGEDYTYFLPKFPTKFSINIPTKDINKQGSYKDTLINMDSVQASCKYSDAEATYKYDAYNNVTYLNDPLGIINNKGFVNNKKKILIIEDSFSWYLTTYLACDVSEIDIIFPMTFNGSIRNYIEEMQPDMVIILYCEKNIEPIDWQTHCSAFDFR